LSRDDRRRHYRFRFHASGTATLDGEGLSATTHDVSLEGICLEVAAQHAPTPGVPLGIDLPHHGVTAQGVVIWALVQRPGRVMVGVRFAHLAVAAWLAA